LPVDCLVRIFPGQPPYPFDTVATVRVPGCSTNLHAYGACGQELRALACRYGADTVFGLSQTIARVGWPSEQSGDVYGGAPPMPDGAAAPVSSLFATLAVKTGAAPVACTPICSPGFACEEGRCIPQCNPPCEQGEVCTRKRVCEASGATGS